MYRRRWGRRHESPDDWIDFRKAGTIVVSERNWIASGCSPDKKRIVSIRWTERRRENGNRRGRKGCLAFAKKKKEKGRDSISSNEILFPVDAFDSIPFFSPPPPLLRSISSSIRLEQKKKQRTRRIRLDSWKTRFLPSRTARYLFLPVPVLGDNGREKLNFAPPPPLPRVDERMRNKLAENPWGEGAKVTERRKNKRSVKGRGEGRDRLPQGTVKE